MTVADAPVVGAVRDALLDIEGQTTLLTGTDLPRRVLLEADVTAVGLDITFKSDTAPAFDVWKAIKYVPLNAGRMWRRDHSFALKTYIGILQGSVGDLKGISAAQTPVEDIDDLYLALHAATRELLFRTTFDQWRSLLADQFAHGYVSSEAIPDDPPTSEAWRAFQELGEWLDLSHGETSDLLGLGNKTAYGWRREGHPPQPRLARRVYQAHALVRQLVLAVGKEDTQAMLARGGGNSGLALIKDNRVAEAEARFADLIYSRSRADESPLGASRSGDQDVVLAIESRPERLAGGRRRLRVKRER